MAGIGRNDMKGQASLLADRLTNLDKIIGSRLKPVVDMEGLDLTWPAFGCSQQQGGRISATAVSHAQRQRRIGWKKELNASQCRVNRRLESRSDWRR